MNGPATESNAPLFILQLQAEDISVMSENIEQFSLFYVLKFFFGKFRFSDIPRSKVYLVSH